MALRIKAIMQYHHSGNKGDANTQAKIFMLKGISCHITPNVPVYRGFT